MHIPINVDQRIVITRGIRKTVITAISHTNSLSQFCIYSIYIGVYYHRSFTDYPGS